MPIKRNNSLKPLSRDHHHGLLLCWKIRTGLSKKIEPKRIMQYADWFYQHHLKPHFEIEERYLFPALDPENAFVKKAISDHHKLNQLFEKPYLTSKDLGEIAEELENHIRFEERILFDEIQKNAEPEKLESIQKIHFQEKFEDNLTDTFWE